MCEGRGDLVGVMRHQHGGRRLGVCGQRFQAGHQLFAARQVQSGGRLVEQQELGATHERAGELHPLLLA